MRSIYARYIVPAVNAFFLLILTLILSISFVFSLTIQDNYLDGFDWILGSLSAGFLAIIITLLIYKFINSPLPFHNFMIRSVIFAFLFGIIFGGMTTALLGASLGSLSGVGMAYASPRIEERVQKSWIVNIPTFFERLIKIIIWAATLSFIVGESVKVYPWPMVSLIFVGYTVAFWLYFKAIGVHPAFCGMIVGLIGGLEFGQFVYNAIQISNSGRLAALSWVSFFSLFSLLCCFAGLLIFVLIEYYGTYEKSKRLAVNFWHFLEPE